METVFDWLRKENVETINEVTVIDSTEPSHSDAAIESALRGFDVEIWDWKKLDLNCDVIATCTGGLARDVSLYSSGNYAVLMGWASTDGLRCKEKFPKVSAYLDRGGQYLVLTTEFEAQTCAALLPGRKYRLLFLMPDQALISSLWSNPEGT
jgi:hypothetical protein